VTRPLWTAEEVAQATRGELRGPAWTAAGVAIDSRTVRPGDLFVALAGPSFDGHDFVREALAKGAAAAMVARIPPGAEAAGSLVHVTDTLAALTQLGRAGRARSQARVVAVTGSVGKTGTKEMLRLGLAAQAPTVASLASLNNHWGVPLSLARIPPDARFAVQELGMNHAGEIAALTRLVRPDVALVTTVEPVHTEFFPSVEAIADAKAEIFQGLPPTGAAVINRDNPHHARLRAAALAQGIARVLDFGADPGAFARLLDVDLHATCSAVDAVIGDIRVAYCLAMPGRHLVMNSLGALAAVFAAGADVGVAAAAFARLTDLPGRGTRHRLAWDGGEVTLIDESYNANPASMRAAIGVLGSTRPEPGGRRIAVVGDMRELGSEGPALHAGLAPDLVAAGIDLVFTCGPLMRALDAALPASMRGPHAAESAALAPVVAAALRAGDVVMVKGSLGTRMAPIVKRILAGPDAPRVVNG